MFPLPLKYICSKLKIKEEIFDIAQAIFSQSFGVRMTL
jgi:hypothetical protein